MINDIFPQNIDASQDVYKLRRHIATLIEKGEVTEEMLELAMRRIVGLNNLLQYIQEANEANADILDNRSRRQNNILEDLYLEFEQGEDTLKVDAATGIGKTIAFLRLIEGTQYRSLIVVPTIDLLNQTIEEAAEWTPSLDISVVNSQNKNFDGKVVITTFASFVINVLNGKFNPNDFDLLILDEAHEGTTPKREEAKSKFVNRLKVDFTATDHKLEGSKLAHKITIQEAILDGILCGVKNIGVFANVDISAAKTESGDYDMDKLDKIIFQHGIDRSMVDLYKVQYYNSPTDRRQVLINCANIEHAERVAKMFKSEGIEARATHSRLDNDERRDVNDAFKNNEFPILCNVRTLTRGWSYSELDVVFNPVPTMSLVHATQRARVTRKSKYNPNKVGEVVDWIYPDKKQILYSEVLKATEITLEDYVTLDITEKADTEENTRKSRGSVFNLGDLKVVTDTVLLAELIKERIAEREAENYIAPEREDGWQHLGELARELGLSLKKINTLAESYFIDYPEEIREMRTHLGRNMPHFSPELSSLFKAEIRDMQKIDDGWRNKNELGAEFDTKPETVERIILREAPKKDIKIEQNVNVKLKISPTGHTQDYYSPELVEVLKEYYEIPEAPETGWYTKNYLEENKIVIENTFLRFLDRNPELVTNDTVRIYRPSRSGPTKHYSQELIDIFHETYGNKAAAEWYTPNDIGRLTGYSGTTVGKFFAQFTRETHPTKVAWMRTKNGIEAEHYHTDLFDLFLDSDFFSTAPEGWIELAIAKDEFNLKFGQLQHILKSRNFETRYYRGKRNMNKVHMQISDYDAVREIVNSRLEG
jgi:superfamily II DNA or RNA helicase